MAKKPLPSPDVLRQLLTYDPESGKLFWKSRPRDAFSSQRSFSTWNARFSGVEALTADNGFGYKAGTIGGQRHRAHRVVWALSYGVWPEGEVDHINGDKSDNRLCNLRLATTSQNQMNRGAPLNNTSGFKGVSWHRSTGKWQARIKVSGIQKTLGYFASAEEAAEAYANAAKKYHGEFARLT